MSTQAEIISPENTQITVVHKAIELEFSPTILGPESEYEKQRIKLRSEIETVVNGAKAVTVIDSPEVAVTANGLGRLLQVASKSTEDFFKPIKQKIDALKSPVLKAEKELADSIETEKRRLGSLLTKYNAEVERLRLEEERKQREAAEAAQREEQLQRAIELESLGDKESAEAVLEEELPPPPVVVRAVVAPKVAGQVGRTVYKAEVVNLMELIKAVAAGTAPIQCIEANMQYLNGKAKLEKEGFNVAGCKLVTEKGTHFRA